MKVVVKRWGNGLAVRLPKRSPELGELEPGMELELTVQARPARKRWEPYTTDLGGIDSQNYREFLESVHHEKPWYRDRHADP